MTRPLIIQKYGGSSLSTPERIVRVAAMIADRARHKARIVVIVSAMGKTTDDLLALAGRITASPSQRELDMLLTVGERISMALLSMALNQINCHAISFTGSQSGIVTNMSHTRALIEEIRADRIRAELDRGKVVIVAGFQGVSRSREITTLGRGGSDTTAVALAAALGARRCEIYSDVAGVYTADPRLVPGARHIPRIGHDEMLELAAAGARVLHYRAAEMARRYRVPLQLRSSFDPSESTVVDSTQPMETTQAISVTCQPDLGVLRITGPRTGSGWPLISKRLSEADINLVAYQKTQTDDETRLMLVVAQADLAATEALAAAIPELVLVKSQRDIASVSVVGTGFARSARAVSMLENVLATAGVSPVLVTTSSHAVHCVIGATDRQPVVEALHRALIETAPAPRETA